MKKFIATILLTTAITSHANADAFDIINHMRIDCSVAKQQYDFLESERSTTSDKLRASFYAKTNLGNIIAQFRGTTNWAYTTRSGTRDAVINLKQSQIREYCWPTIPIGY